MSKITAMFATRAFARQAEVTPMLMRVNQTVNVMRNTTTLVNENIAQPAMRVAGFFAGLRRSGKVASGKVSGGKTSKRFKEK